MTAKPLILEKIRQSGGKISFSDYMSIALYDPHFGYYTSKNTQLGRAGDFVTAPELSPLFGLCLSQSLKTLPYSQVLEFGAGTGKLAKILLENNMNIQKYYICEISPSLKLLQQKNLDKYLDKIIWIDKLPQEFKGIILANEVLDAFPVMKFLWKNNQAYEYYVTENFEWKLVPIENNFIKNLNLPDNYSSEINFNIKPWLNKLNQMLTEGVIYIFDYGYPREEYYHPQRSMGTLRCHYQHRAHNDPLSKPGEQDITAHVDFTAVTESEFNLLGYTSQAAFLLECDITQFIKTQDDSNAVKILTHPAEMGEIIKAMVLSKNYEAPIRGFTHYDRSYIFSRPT